MSGSFNLSQANIREGAMNSPAGTARAYEEMFARRLEQAVADEARLRREGDEMWRRTKMEAAMRRALDRSGIYNVASMLIPQDAGEVALGLAMTPKIGLGLRTALAALGGMTTQIGEAEGAFLPREMFRRLRGHPDAAARREAARGEDAISDVERATGVRNIDLQNMPAENLNVNFPDLLSMGAVHGTLPTEAGWAAMLDPTRPLRYLPAQRQVAGMPNELLALELRDAAMGMPLRLTPRTLNEYRFDPWLESAIGAGNPRTIIDGDMRDYGFYRPSNDQIGLAGTNNFLHAQHTLEHELQHRVQHFANDRYLTGAAPRQVSRRNSPELWTEYLQRAQASDPNPTGWTHASGGMAGQDAIDSARHSMYANNFGEWEARLAAQTQMLGRVNPNYDWRQVFQGLVDNTFQEPMPDFRIR